MRCPFCKNPDTFVRDSRPFNEGNAIKRKRSCNECKAKFTTQETVMKRSISVVKRSGNIEEFLPEKILQSLYHAAKKSNLSTQNIDELLQKVLSAIDSQHYKKVSTKAIVQIILNILQSSGVRKLYSIFHILYTNN